MHIHNALNSRSDFQASIRSPRLRHVSLSGVSMWCVNCMRPVVSGLQPTLCGVHHTEYPESRLSVSGFSPMMSDRQPCSRGFKSKQNNMGLGNSRETYALSRDRWHQEFPEQDSRSLSYYDTRYCILILEIPIHSFPLNWIRIILPTRRPRSAPLLNPPGCHLCARPRLIGCVPVSLLTSLSEPWCYPFLVTSHSHFGSWWLHITQLRSWPIFPVNFTRPTW